MADWPFFVCLILMGVLGIIFWIWAMEKTKRGPRE